MKSKKTEQASSDPGNISDQEVEDLLVVIYKHYGYDFREYSKAHIKRRLLNRMLLTRSESVSDFEQRILSDKSFAALFLKDLSIGVTEMFRDPELYKVLREKVIPVLKTWSFLKIWHAGCSTGEEVYSMAILLREEGIYERTRIYATDFNQLALKKAREGIYPAESMKKYAKNYQATGSNGEFSDYFHAKYNSAILDKSLKKNIVWANHNLVTDSDFSEAHMIICRNVLIYFNRNLQHKVYKLFNSSLVKGGILCLGSKESLQFTSYDHVFQSIDKKQRLYRKKYV